MFFNLKLFLIKFFIFVFGAVIGSFVNLCIYRIPLEISIVAPFSFCPLCKRKIKIWHNIPILSYIFLRGRCAYCKGRIDFRYFTIELISGLCAVACFVNFFFTFDALVFFVFIELLIIASFIDIDYQIIPDFISFGGVPLFLLASLKRSTITFYESFLGMLAGALILFCISYFYKKIRHKEGLGAGDIKFLAMIGSVIGLSGVFFTLFFASLVGSLSGFLIALGKKDFLNVKIAFGPFLSIGAVLYVFWGEQIIFYYYTF